MNVQSYGHGLGASRLPRTTPMLAALVLAFPLMAGAAGTNSYEAGGAGANGTDSVAIGYSSSTWGNSDTAYGAYNNVNNYIPLAGSDTYSTALGNRNEVVGTHSTAVGAQNTVGGILCYRPVLHP